MTPNRAQERESELAHDEYTMSDQIRDILARARSHEIRLETAFGGFAAESTYPCRAGSWTLFTRAPSEMG